MSGGASQPDEGTPGASPGPAAGSWRASVTAAGMAVVLAFVTVFFGWLPNPFADDTGETMPTPEQPLTGQPPGSTAPGLEVLARAFPDPSRIPAKYGEGSSSRNGTVLASRLLLTLRNRGDLKAVVTAFRFTIVTARPLQTGKEPDGCLPKTGGDTKITANYDVVLPDTDEDELPRTVEVKESYDLAAGDAERVMLTLGLNGEQPLEPVLYVVQIHLREGRTKDFIPAGTIAFLAPVEPAAHFLRWTRALADSDAVLCDTTLHRDVNKALTTSDDHSSQVDALMNDLNALKR